MRSTSILAVSLVLGAMAAGSAAQGTFGFLMDFNACGCGTGWVGGWAGATDNYDDALDYREEFFTGIGYVAVFHQRYVDDWDGPTGYYPIDARAPLAANERKTWTPIHLWAGPLHIGPIMAIAYVFDDAFPMPTGREYTLELLYVPPEVAAGAPAVGSLWTLDPAKDFALWVPTFYTGGDGRFGYRFALSISAQTLRGDTNCDGAVTFKDIDPFVAALNGRAAWEAINGGEPACGYMPAADINHDGSVSFKDIDPFVACLSGDCEE